MLKKTTFNLVLGLFMLVCFNACIKDVDFDQADDLSISPALEVSMMYFEEPAATFVDEIGDELSTIRDTLNIEIFNDEFVVDNLIKADLLFEITNSINRSFNAQVDFYNDMYELQHNFNFEVGASTNNQDVVVEYVEVFEGPDLESIKTTTNIVFTLSLDPSIDGSILDDNSFGQLELKSKGSFYFEIFSSE